MTRLWFVFYNFFITAQWMVVLVLKCQSCSSVLAGTCFSKIWLLTHYAMAISPSGKIDLVNKPVEQSYSEIISALPKKIDTSICNLLFYMTNFQKTKRIIKRFIEEYDDNSTYFAFQLYASKHNAFIIQKSQSKNALNILEIISKWQINMTENPDISG